MVHGFADGYYIDDSTAAKFPDDSQRTGQQLHFQVVPVGGGQAEKLAVQVVGPENLVGRLDRRQKAYGQNTVRRAKACIFSGCKSRPATVVPAGSNRSGSGGNEIVEAFDATGRIWRLLPARGSGNGAAAWASLGLRHGQRLRPRIGSCTRPSSGPRTPNAGRRPMSRDRGVPGTLAHRPGVAGLVGAGRAVRMGGGRRRVRTGLRQGPADAWLVLRFGRAVQHVDPGPGRDAGPTSAAAVAAGGPVGQSPTLLALASPGGRRQGSEGGAALETWVQAKGENGRVGPVERLPWSSARWPRSRRSGTVLILEKDRLGGKSRPLRCHRCMRCSHGCSNRSRQPPPGSRRSHVLRRNEEARIYHWYAATGEFPPRRGQPDG